MSKSKNLFLKALLRLLIVWWVVLLPSIPIASAAPVCSAQLVDSYFYNPDFESYSALPNDWSYPNSSQVNRLHNWHQTTQGTTDFWHDNGVKDPGVLSPTAVGHATHLLPYSSTTTKGGAVGFITAKTEDYAEYVGQCLKNPLIAGKSYRLKMRIGYLDNTGFSTGGDVSGHLIALGRTACPSSIPLAGSDNKEGDAGYTLLGATAINHQWENGWYNVEIDMNPSVNMPYVMFGLRKSSLVAERDNAYAIVDELVLNEQSCVPSSYRDYGDAPATYGSPAHSISSTVKMGVLVDADTQSSPTLTADGDDKLASDDEDGVILPSKWVAQMPASLSINVTGSGGYLNAWIDWNRDGDFYDVDEQVITALADNAVGDTNTAMGTITVTITPPLGLGGGVSYARFRWSTTPNLDASAGIATNGEVEDYSVNLEKYLPIINNTNICTASGGTDVLFLLDNSGSVDSAEYSTFASNVVTISQELLNANPATRIATAHYAGDMLGITPTPGQNIYFERDFSRSALSMPIKQFGFGTAYHDYSSDNTVAALYQASFGLDANASTTSALIVSPLKELGRDLTRPLQIVIFTDAVRHEHAGSTLLDIAGQAFDPDDGSNFTTYNKFKAQGVKFAVAAFPVSAVFDAEKTPTVAAIASKGGNYTGSIEANPQDPEGSGVPRRLVIAGVGFTLSAAQVTELVTPIAAACPASAAYDFGDAPSTYGSARHTLVNNGVYLGTNPPDSENSALYSNNAQADDTNSGDDEDALIGSALAQGITGTLTIQVKGAGYLNAWLDWNNNGVFDLDEQIAHDIQDNLTGDSHSSVGLITLNVSVPSTAALMGILRLRWSSTSNITAIQSVVDGEVEDHQVAIVAANSPPIITSNGGGDSAVINIPEGTNTVTTVTATDADNDTLSYALAGGSDAALFTINASTGVLTFKAVPDYESPQDTGANNQYMIIVSASDNKGGMDTQTLTINVTDMPEGVNLSIKALLQGSYDAGSGLMKDNLRALNLIPLNQPYGNYAAFNYTGTEAINSTRLAQSGLNAVVDWIIVELRSALNPTVVVTRQAALLTRNGNIVSANTDSPNLHLLGVSNGSYYIALRHRNHLGIMSQSPIALTLGGTTHIDFSLISTASYGMNSRALIGENALMWAGNANLDTYIIANGPHNDTSNILSSVLIAKDNLLFNSNYAYKGYLNTDIDMDGFAVFAGPGNDINVLVSNILLHPSNTTFSANYVLSGALAN